MINDIKRRDEIAEDLKSARKIAGARINGETFGLPGYGFVNMSAPAPPAAYNLALVLAYAALDEALDEMRTQSPPVFTFKGKKAPLGPKMKASLDQGLPWQDYDLVWEGKEARDSLAHEAQYVLKEDCLRYIDAVRDEFKAWGIS